MSVEGRGPFAESVRQADHLLGRLEAAAGEAASDPDGPALPGGGLTSCVRCTRCAYVVTEPFENADRCPACFFAGDAAREAAKELIRLPPIGEVLAVVRQAKAERAAREAAGPQPKGGKGKGGGGGGKGKGGGGKQEVQDGAGAGAAAQPKGGKGGGPRGAKGGAKGAQAQQLNDVEKAKLCVAKVVSVKDHPASDKLLCIQIDVGGERNLSVCAGLKAYYSAADLQDKLVVVITNLKAAKLGGELSEAMILAATTPGASDDAPPTVRHLVPPEGTAPGTKVFRKGDREDAQGPKTLSSTIWKRVVPLLKVNDDHQASADGTPFIIGGPEPKPITLPDDIAPGSTIN